MLRKDFQVLRECPLQFSPHLEFERDAPSGPVYVARGGRRRLRGRPDGEAEVGARLHLVHVGDLRHHDRPGGQMIFLGAFKSTEIWDLQGIMKYP